MKSNMWLFSLLKIFCSELDSNSIFFLHKTLFNLNVLKNESLEMLRLSKDEYKLEVDNERFEKVLLKCIDRALLILGESPRKAIYFHLEKRERVKREEIPEKLDEFIEGLRAIFGSGSFLIEKRIVEELFKEFEIPYPHRENSHDLVESLNYVANVLVRKNKGEE